ncbi:hypothetical protein ACIBVL_37275 [Streptomyces sp. NPDC049687]|uniref:hypothetical protein n=1 Tax=Streptomyces sp. NPDC049687 TaxID=3365596 RepID=UPI003787AA8B
MSEGEAVTVPRQLTLPDGRPALAAWTRSVVERWAREARRVADTHALRRPPGRTPTWVTHRAHLRRTATDHRPTAPHAPKPRHGGGMEKTEGISRARFLGGAALGPADRARATDAEPDRATEGRRGLRHRGVVCTVGQGETPAQPRHGARALSPQGQAYVNSAFAAPPPADSTRNSATAV